MMIASNSRPSGINLNFVFLQTSHNLRKGIEDYAKDRMRVPLAYRVKLQWETWKVLHVLLARFAAILGIHLKFSCFITVFYYLRIDHTIFQTISHGFILGEIHVLEEKSKLFELRARLLHDQRGAALPNLSDIFKCTKLEMPISVSVT